MLRKTIGCGAEVGGLGVGEGAPRSLPAALVFVLKGPGRPRFLRSHPGARLAPPR